MPSKIQLARYESLIKDVVNKVLNYEIKDKIAVHATCTYVKLTNDLSYAYIYLDCLHRDSIQKVVDHVDKTKGYIRSVLSKHWKAYKIPQLVFEPDQTIDYVNKIDALFEEIKKKEEKK